VATLVKSVEWCKSIQRRINVSEICQSLILVSLYNTVLRGPITVAALSKAWNVFTRSIIGIVGSNPTRDMDVCPRFFCICVQGVLLTLFKIHSSRLILIGNRPGVKVEWENVLQEIYTVLMIPSFRATFPRINLKISLKIQSRYILHFRWYMQWWDTINTKTMGSHSGPKYGYWLLSSFPVPAGYYLPGAVTVTFATSIDTLM
jgi:hypothetical protein